MLSKRIGTVSKVGGTTSNGHKRNVNEHEQWPLWLEWPWTSLISSWIHDFRPWTLSKRTRTAWLKRHWTVLNITWTNASDDQYDLNATNNVNTPLFTIRSFKTRRSKNTILANLNVNDRVLVWQTWTMTRMIIRNAGYSQSRTNSMFIQTYSLTVYLPRDPSGKM